LTPKGQVALLRFLQEMEYRPLGSSSNIKANVRIITATNVSLDELEGCGEFRRDLLYRLNIMPLRMPALRKREDDVFCLAEHFFAKLRFRYGQSEKYLHPSSVDWMRRYDWPGNIRELENLIHRQFLLANDAAVHLGCESINDTAMAAELFCADLSAGFKEAKARAIEAFERDYLTRLLDECGGNVSHAARVAGKERRALGKLIKKYGIDKFQHS
jgi:DNA-binding NtrC family response regulator